MTGTAAGVAGSRAGPADPDWAAAVAARARPAAAPAVLLTCHVNPDGDALGSMLGFGLGLRRSAYRRAGDLPRRRSVPEPFRCLPGLDLLVPADAPDPARTW